MSKPSIQNIVTTQTFQNWLDKTNEMVDIMRDSAITASVSGDTTTGDATLVGEFTANNVVVFNELLVDYAESRTAGENIVFGSSINIVPSLSAIAATFNYGAGGGRTRYTDGVVSWDVGFDNSTNANFQINQGAGGQFSLSPAGVLTVPSIVTEAGADVSFGGDVTIDGVLTANTATFVSATGTFSGTLSGNFTGDIYHPAGNKVFENGGPAAGVPAVFTGNVNGTVSSLTNHSTNTLAEGTNNTIGESSPGAKDGGNNLYFTTARARASIVAGTGVTYTSSSGTIAIGQAVATTSDVTFKTVKATGDITAFSSVSDIRLKENIKPIGNALDKVSKLGGYTFNYKNNPNIPMTGVMAQELLEVLPEAVYKTIDGNTGEEIYAVRHGNVIGLLIEAIKELNEKVGK